MVGRTRQPAQGLEVRTNVTASGTEGSHSLLLLREELSTRLAAQTSPHLPWVRCLALVPLGPPLVTSRLEQGGRQGAFSSGGRTGEGAVSFPAAVWLSLTSRWLLARATVTSCLPPAVHAMWPLYRLCHSTVTPSFRARKGTSLLSSLRRGLT